MKEIVILGAGYAGLRALHFLQAKKGKFHITLVDRNKYHYESIELQEVAAGTQNKNRIIYPIKDIVSNQVTSFVQGTVRKIKRKEQKVILNDKKIIHYDFLIISLGFRSETFEIPGAEKNALQLDDIESAERIHSHLIEKMKHYKRVKDPNDLKIVVCGCGFTGIELLGELCNSRRELSNIAGVKPKQIKLFTINSQKRLLPMLTESLVNYGVSYLGKKGVKFLTGKTIKEVFKNKVEYVDKVNVNKTGEINSNTIIWTIGVSGSQVIQNSGFKQHRDRVMVRRDLRDPDFRNVYVIGDCSAVLDPSTNHPYPTTAQISLQMGEQAAKNILFQLKGKQTKKFKFSPLGIVASLGRTNSLGNVGKFHLRGFLASILKKFIANKSLLSTGGIRELFSKGRFDFYH